MPHDKVNIEWVEGFKGHVNNLPDDMTLSQWLEALEMLQKVSYNAFYDNFDDATRADSMLMNLYALVCEVVEMGDEMGWKPWAQPRGWINAEKAVKEAADQMHFQGNLLKHAHATGEQLGRELKAKMLKNLQRQLDGYDTRTEKCGYCHRDLSEVNPFQVVQLPTIGGRPWKPAEEDAGPDQLPGGVIITKFCNQSHADLFGT